MSNSSASTELVGNVDGKNGSSNSNSNNTGGASSSSRLLMTTSVVLLGLVSSAESFSSTTTTTTSTTRRPATSLVLGGRRIQQRTYSKQQPPSNYNNNPLRLPFQFKTTASVSSTTTSTSLFMSSASSRRYGGTGDVSSHPYAHYYGTSGSTARQNYEQHDETLDMYGYMEDMDRMDMMGGPGGMGPPPPPPMSPMSPRPAFGPGVGGGFGGEYMDSLYPGYDDYGSEYMPPPPPPSMTSRPIRSMQDSGTVRERRDGLGLGLERPERSFYNSDRSSPLSPDRSSSPMSPRRRGDIERDSSRYEYLRHNALANNDMMDRVEGRHVLDRLDDLLMEHDDLRRRLMAMEDRTGSSGGGVGVGGGYGMPPSPSSSSSGLSASTESLQRQVDALIQSLYDEQGRNPTTSSAMTDTIMSELRTVQHTLATVQAQSAGGVGVGGGMGMGMGMSPGGLGGPPPPPPVGMAGPGRPFNPQVQPPPPQPQGSVAPPQQQQPPPPPPPQQQQQTPLENPNPPPFGSTPPAATAAPPTTPASPTTTIPSSSQPPPDMQVPPPPPPPVGMEDVDDDMMMMDDGDDESAEVNGSDAASLNSFQQRQMNMKEPPQAPPRDTSAPRKTLLRDRGQLQNEERAGQIPYGGSQPPPPSQSAGGGGPPPPQAPPGGIPAGINGGSGVSINGSSPNTQQQPPQSRSRSGYTPRGGIPPRDDGATFGQSMPNGGGSGRVNGVVSNTGMNIHTGSGVGRAQSQRSRAPPPPPPPEEDDDDSFYPKGGVNTFEPGQGPAAQQRAYQRRSRGGGSGSRSTFGGSGGSSFGGSGGGRRGGGGGGSFGSGSGFQGGVSTGASRHGKNFGEESGTMTFSDGPDGGRCFLT